MTKQNNKTKQNKTRQDKNLSKLCCSGEMLGNLKAFQKKVSCNCLFVPGKRYALVWSGGLLLNESSFFLKKFFY
jgi:hypothetical protein